MKNHEWPKFGTLHTMKIELKKFLKLWNIAKVYIQIQMVCIDTWDTKFIRKFTDLTLHNIFYSQIFPKKKMNS